MTVDFADAILRLVAAAGLAGVIGVERQFAQKEAGLRTHMLVGLGAGLFAFLGIEAFPAGPGADPARVAAQIVTGIGFLGAGAIVRYGPSIQGLTTAAGLWTAAAVGMAAGMAEYEVALIATGVAVVVLYIVGVSQWMLRGRVHEASVRIRLRVAPDVELSATCEAARGVVGPSGSVDIEEIAPSHTTLIASTTPDGADGAIAGLSDLPGVERVTRAHP